MRLLRATLLLIVLPAMLPAAPAPLARVNRHPATGGWSETVGGLRVRLVANQTAFRLDEAVQLVMEIQNVTTSAIEIEEPYLAHYVATPDNETRGWALTCEREVDPSIKCRLVRERVRMKQDVMRISSVTLLGAGKTMQIDVTIQNDRRGDEKERELKEGERRAARLRFDDADWPGFYELRATFTRDFRRNSLRENGWQGESLKTPPVRIELRK